MKFINAIVSTALFTVFMTGMSSCDNLVYEQQGDCTPKVQFILKKHRQALQAYDGRINDAFYSSVGSVHLFVYDLETGELVLDQKEYTHNLQSFSELNLGTGTDRCLMPVDLKPGKYKMVAWCGLDENDHNNAFYLTEDATRAGYSECKIKLSSISGQPVNEEKYESLFHGSQIIEIKPSDDGQNIIPLELTKNTNDIAVWVQHTSKTFNLDDYEVVYTDANGSMHFETNAITADNLLDYHPHSKSMLTASTEYNGNIMETGALVAHLSTSRLLESNKEDARLEVRDKAGNTVFSIPFIKYLLEMQTFTSDGQYYLDCEDTFNCSFYLTGDTQINGQWLPAMIIINNWVRVPDQNSEI